MSAQVICAHNQVLYNYNKGIKGMLWQTPGKEYLARQCVKQKQEFLNKIYSHVLKFLFLLNNPYIHQIIAKGFVPLVHVVT